LDVEPRFFYYRDNRFHARVLGSLKIHIEPDKLPAHLAAYNVLEINEFDPALDANYSLNWTAHGRTHQVPLNKTRHSLTPFDFQAQDAADITDLHILFEANHELGNRSRFEQQASFQAVRLTQAGLHNQWAINRSEWLDLTPVKFNTINGYTSSQDPHLRGLIMRLSLWLMISIGLLIAFKLRHRHLFLTLLVAWMVPAGVYLHNHFNQHQQLTEAFSEDSLNLNQLDQEARQMAAQIEQQLPAILAQGPVSNKLILVGPKDFFHLRLMRHLFALNVGLDAGFSRMLNLTNDQHLFILSQNALRFCTNPEQHDWLSGQVKVVFRNSQFCIMRKL